MRLQPRFVLPVLSTVLAIGLVLAIVLAGSRGNRSSPQSTANGAFDGAAYPLGVRAPGFVLENQQGRRVSLSALRGQVVLLAFVSTACRTCLVAAQQVRGALDELADTPTYGQGTAIPAMQALFLSTDPRSDTRARVRRFLADASLTGRSQYLTGSAAQLRAVWRAYRLPRTNASRAASEAAVTVLLIGREGTERVGFGLEQLTPESLSHDIRLLRDGRSAPTPPPVPRPTAASGSGHRRLIP